MSPVRSRLFAFTKEKKRKKANFISLVQMFSLVLKLVFVRVFSEAVAGMLLTMVGVTLCIVSSVDDVGTQAQA